MLHFRITIAKVLSIKYLYSTPTCIHQTDTVMLCSRSISCRQFSAVYLKHKTTETNHDIEEAILNSWQCLVRQDQKLCKIGAPLNLPGGERFSSSAPGCMPRVTPMPNSHIMHMLCKCHSMWLLLLQKMRWAHLCQGEK